MTQASAPLQEARTGPRPAGPAIVEDMMLLLLTTLRFVTGCANDNLVVYDSSRQGEDAGDDGIHATEGWDLSDTGTTDDPGDGGGSSGDGGDDDGGSGADGGSGDDGGGDGGGTDTTPDVGDLVISELMIDAAAVADAHGEWVELYNDSDRSLQLAGLILGDDGVDRWQLTDPVTVAPGDYAVICADTLTADNGGVSCDGSFYANTWGDGFALANSGDEVNLLRADGTRIDRMTYTEGQVVAGVALGVRAGSLSADGNDASSAWCPQSSPLPGGDLGTPGGPNDGC